MTHALTQLIRIKNAQAATNGRGNGRETRVFEPVGEKNVRQELAVNVHARALGAARRGRVWVGAWVLLGLCCVGSGGLVRRAGSGANRGPGERCSSGLQLRQAHAVTRRGAFGTVLRTDDGGGSGPGSAAASSSIWCEVWGIDANTVVIVCGCLLRCLNDVGKRFACLPLYGPATPTVLCPHRLASPRRRRSWSPARTLMGMFLPNHGPAAEERPREMRFGNWDAEALGGERVRAARSHSAT